MNIYTLHICIGPRGTTIAGDPSLETSLQAAACLLYFKITMLSYILHGLTIYTVVH